MNRALITITAVSLIILCFALIIAYRVVGSPPHTTQTDVTINSNTLSATVTKADSTWKPSPTPYLAPASAPLIATPMSPTNPLPSSTPTQHKLADLVETSNGIAEVEVSSVYNWAFVARVKRWLKPITLPNDQVHTDVPNPPFVSVYLQAKDIQLVQAGGQYLIFIQEGDPYEWCQSVGYNLTFDSEGLYEIRNGMIVHAELSRYIGKSVIELESDLFHQMPSGAQVPSATLPDSGQKDLIQIVHSSDLILEATGTSGEGSTGGVFLGFKVDKVLKRPTTSIPDAIKDDNIALRFMQCSNTPDGAGRRYILFVQGTEELGNPDSVSGLGYFGIDNSNKITRGGFTHPFQELHTVDSLNHYAGWTLQQLEAAISDAMQAPYTPQPTPTEDHP